MTLPPSLLPAAQRSHLAAGERLRASKAAAERTGASQIASLLEQDAQFEAEHPPTAEIDDVLAAFALYLGEATQSYVAARAEVPRRTTPLPPNPAKALVALGAADASTWLNALSELAASDLAALQLLATLRADGSQRSAAAATTTPNAHRSAAPMALSPLSLRSHAPPGAQRRPGSAPPGSSGLATGSSSNQSSQGGGGSSQGGSASSLASLSGTSHSAGAARIGGVDDDGSASSAASTRYNRCGSSTSLSSDSYSALSSKGGGSAKSLFPAPPPFAKGGRSAPSVSIDGGNGGNGGKVHRAEIRVSNSDQQFVSGDL